MSGGPKDSEPKPEGASDGAPPEGAHRPITIPPATIASKDVAPVARTPITIPPKTIGSRDFAPAASQPITIPPKTMGPRSSPTLGEGAQPKAAVSVSVAVAAPLNVAATMGASPPSVEFASRAPMSVGPMSVGPMSRAPMSRAPMSRGPMSRGPMSRGPMSAGPATVGARNQRSVKNYLIDRRLQLRYAGLLLGVVLALSSAFGWLLWSTSQKLLAEGERVVTQAKLTTEQGREAARRAKEAVEERRRSRDIVKLYVDEHYANDPEVGKTLSEQETVAQRKLASEEQQVREDAEALDGRVTEIDAETRAAAALQGRLLLGLLGLLSVAVLAVGAAGIVFTHRVAGPIFKMSRILREIGTGRLVIYEKLRQGDELQEFFGALSEMVEGLRVRRRDDISELQIAIEILRETQGSQAGVAESLERLELLRNDLAEQLEP